MAYDNKNVMPRTRRNLDTNNASSMADIAFLLLIFFMVTTTIVNDKGIDMVLPPDVDERPPVPIHERNIFAILINSENKLLVKNELRPSYELLREDVKKFVLNNGQNPEWSVTPKDAVVSIKANRGTTQGAYIKVLDEIKAAYYEIYADKLGLTSAAIRNNDFDLRQHKLYSEIRKEIPMNISVAEPN